MDSLGKLKPALQNSHTTDSSSLNQSSGGGQVITPLSAPVISNIVPSSTSSSGGAATVAQGLAQMFTHLQLNLQGIELSKPTLLIVSEGDKPLLEINMKMRIRSIPPLNMEF
ncbi:hypothetical protein CEUSTIGMA_g4664.t1 [Chlamydomonas eustigma]|uniref:Uncharacterized protein n=1 Tax=Chlamydomonas eustigma TaxID=1157962 RepID=A0A250X2C4_9CHLO|nr:hypothetical protein CEUSTIGMA_g4664.t1 [Chlamydomonas eustigma]|eukprot:GAX77218.1 hypothetical protein CEUSTIGMA_g4664.t1 [Chlamydomonas eustigma]